MATRNLIFTGLSILALAAQPALAGHGSSGGGDAVKQDFVIAAQLAYQVLNQEGSALTPPVDASKFVAAIDPAHIESTDQTLTYQGTVVDAFYDASTDMIEINRARWQQIQDENEKVRLAAHEIFRRIGVADDNYQESSQIQVLYEALFNYSQVTAADYVPADRAGSPKTCWIHLEKQSATSALSASLNQSDSADTACASELLGWSGQTFDLQCDPKYGMDCESSSGVTTDPELGKFVLYAGLNFDDSYNFTLNMVRVSLEEPPATLPPDVDPCYYSICTWTSSFVRSP